MCVLGARGLSGWLVGISSCLTVELVFREAVVSHQAIDCLQAGRRQDAEADQSEFGTPR
jgi:hypothetical protein